MPSPSPPAASSPTSSGSTCHQQKRLAVRRKGVRAGCRGASAVSEGWGVGALCHRSRKLGCALSAYMGAEKTCQSIFAPHCTLNSVFKASYIPSPQKHQN